MSGYTLDHIGIASRDLTQIRDLARGLFGIELGTTVDVPSQLVKVSFSDTLGDTKLELIEPTSEKNPNFKVLPHPLKRFLEDMDHGLHHLCFSVPDIHEALGELERKGVRSLTGIQQGAGGHKVAFLDTKKTAGILIELIER